MSNSKSDEYQTPKIYVNAAREVMGSIDLDPASSEINNVRLKIPQIFTKSDNAFDCKWYGNVWLNPPYSKPNLTYFTNYLINMFNDANTVVPRPLSIINQLIYLIPSSTSEKWYQKCLQNASAICLPNHRINFLLNGKVQDSPRMSNTFFYFGNYSVNILKFCKVFQKFGFVQELKK